jgi:flagellar basal-body rod modification protein FlgD
MANISSTSSVSSSSDLFAAINAANSAGSSTSASTAAAQEDRFLKLLVTQLQNQDPLNPMDNAQFTTQMAQISTVTGIEKVNQTLGSMIDSVASSQNVQSAAMIGKSVMVAGSKLVLTSSTTNGVTSSSSLGGIKLDSAADQVTLTIKDSSGKVQSTQTLGAQAAGTFNSSWDGMTDDKTSAPAGTYSVSVSATQGGKAVVATTLQLGTVSALTRSGSSYLLDLGSLGSVALADVQQIL